MNEVIRSWLAVAGLFVLGFLLFPLVAVGQQEDGPDQVKLLHVTPDIVEVVAKDMDGCPAQGSIVRGGINKNGVYTLTGDVFGNGNIYAIIDNDQNVIMCQWTKSQWKAEWVINEGTAWKSAKWYSDEDAGREPVATIPFWTITLQRRHLLVMASGVEKQGADYSILLLDSDCRSLLDSDYSFDSPPEVKDDYLVTTDASRVKATFTATFYSRIQNGKLIVLKSWVSSYPYDQPDPSEYDGDAEATIASTDGRAYMITQDYKPGGNKADIVIFTADPSEGEFQSWRDIIYAWKTRKVFARIYIGFVRKERFFQEG